MFNLMSVVALSLPLLALPLASDEVDPDLERRFPPDKMVIDDASTGGHCKYIDPDSFEFSKDGTAFTLPYGPMILRVDGTPHVTVRMDCHLRLRVHVPRGRTFATVQVDHTLDLQLSPPVIAELQTSYSFPGLRRPTRWMQYTGKGGDVMTEMFDISSFAILPCGADRYLSMHLQMTLDSGSGYDEESWVRMLSSAVTITTTRRDDIGLIPCPLN